MNTKSGQYGNIRDLEKFNDGLADWSILNDCFGGKIKPTDIDGCVERNCEHLFLEWKTPGGCLKTGQRIALERLARKPQNTVFVIWGQPRLPERLLILRGDGSWEKEVDVEELQKWARRWKGMADRTRLL